MREPDVARAADLMMDALRHLKATKQPIDDTAARFVMKLLAAQKDQRWGSLPCRWRRRRPWRLLRGAPAPPAAGVVVGGGISHRYPVSCASPHTWILSKNLAFSVGHVVLSAQGGVWGWILKYFSRFES